MTKPRRFSLAFGLASVLALTAAPAAAVSSYAPATPEPGTEIPQVSVTFGMRPYADNTFYVIGMEKGWFEDVGIKIEPEPYGLKTSENQWVSILLNRQVDINTATCSTLLPSYRTTDQLKCAGFAVTFFGAVMLANPKLGLKTVRDYVNEGASFEEGLKSALSPLVGETVYVPAAVSEKEFNMHPGGAPIAQTLLDAGWTPIYDTGQLLEFGPGGVDSPLESLVFNNGWAATADYINENQTTMLRFASVVFRIFAELENDPSLFGVYAPYLNSVAGTSLDADGVRRTVVNLDPFVPFEQQAKYFVDEKSPEYYRNSMGALIAALEASGTIPTGITPDEVLWAAPMWHEMVDYKEKAEALFEQAKTADLGAEQQALLDDAHRYYGWYDFLDAYRLATAALAN